MFGRIRRLEISLAAKCQILFGAAVLLIISAALLVPWQRMEQLTQQLDERAAAALADDAVARHIERGGASDPTPPVAAPEPVAGDEEPPDASPTDADARLWFSRPSPGRFTHLWTEHEGSQLECLSCLKGGNGHVYDSPFAAFGWALSNLRGGRQSDGYRDL